MFVLLMAGLQLRAQSSLDRKIAAAGKVLRCGRPDEGHPVLVGAMLVSEGDSIGVIVKAVLAPGWHIYDYVPPSLPYIPIETILKLPPTIRAVGGWVKSQATASASDPGVLIYEGEAVFVHKAVRVSERSAVAGGGIIQTGLYYQTCNMRQCLQPVEKTIELTF